MALTADRYELAEVLTQKYITGIGKMVNLFSLTWAYPTFDRTKPEHALAIHLGRYRNLSAIRYEVHGKDSVTYLPP
jgi:hypothetical protein